MSIFNENVFRATNLSVSKRDDVFTREKLDRLKQVAVAKRKQSLSQLDALWERAAFGFGANGVDVVFAADAKKANATIRHTLADARLIVKGKSLTTEEIGLRQSLEADGKQVVETDLGEWIIQQRNELPSHVTAPAIHLSSGDVAKLIRKQFNVDVTPEPASLTRFVREHLRERFVEADAGIVGANMVVADPASIICVSNEGNVSLSARLPRKLVVVVGVDRIYDNPTGIQGVQQLLTASATGQQYTSYIDVIRKPLPHQEITIVVLDNGRRRLLSGEFSEAGRCIRCGACLNICPVYQEVGGHVFGKVYHGGIGALLTAFTGRKDEAAAIADYCMRCGSCEANCPMDIPISSLVSRLSDPERLPFYLKWPLQKMKRAGAGARPAVLVEREGPVGTNEAPVVRTQGVFLGCVLRSPLLKETQVAIQNAMSFLEPKPVVFDQGCCGMPHFYKGMIEEAQVRLDDLASMFRDMDRILIPCSSGYAFLRKQLGDRIELMSIALASDMTQVKPDRRVFYHVPCHLKTEAGAREWEALIRIVPLEEWEHGERCCGSAGTYFIQHPGISRHILKRKDVPGKDPYFIITSCPSCLIQLRRTFGRKNVLHTVDFLMREQKSR